MAYNLIGGILMRYTILSFILLVCGFTNSAFATNYQFIANNHHVANQQVVVRQKIVEFDSDYFLGLNGYYSVQNQLLQQYLVQLQAQNLNKIEKVENSKVEEKLDEIIRLLKGGTKLEPVPTPTAEPAPKPEVPVNSEVSELDKQVFAILVESCKRCHNSTNKSGGLTLVGQDSKGDYLPTLSLGQRLNVHYRTRGVGLAEHGLKTMPLGGVPLSDEKVETFYQWALEGK